MLTKLPTIEQGQGARSSQIVPVWHMLFTDKAQAKLLLQRLISRVNCRKQSSAAKLKSLLWLVQRLLSQPRQGQKNSRR